MSTPKITSEKAEDQSGESKGIGGFSRSLSRASGELVWGPSEGVWGILDWLEGTIPRVSSL